MQAVIFIGIQASGKSSFYKERFFNTHIRINLDMLRTRNREDILLEACLRAKQPFVVDNTNPTVESRAKYLNIAHDAGFSVIGYYFQSKVQDSIERNNLRDGAQRVPLPAIYGTSRRLQVPTLAEGFEALNYVSIKVTGEFQIEEWLGEV